MSDKKLREYIERIAPVPYPDYNLGLLPDEDGYDELQLLRNYEHGEQVELLMQFIKDYALQSRIDELERIGKESKKNLDIYYAHRISELKAPHKNERT